MNTPRLILDLNNCETTTDEDVARDISNKLYEEKDTLLRKWEVHFLVIAFLLESLSLTFGMFAAKKVYFSLNNCFISEKLQMILGWSDDVN